MQTHFLNVCDQSCRSLEYYYSKGLLHYVRAQAVRWRLTAHVKRSRSLRALRLPVGGYAEHIVSRVVRVRVEVACILRRAILGLPPQKLEC